MTSKRIVGGVVAGLVAGTMMACGGSSSPTSPDDDGPSGPGSVGATITITAAGVNPVNVTVNAGQSVMLVNSDGKRHEISSNPHPSHGDCPALNFGGLDAGQSRTSNALNTARTCGFHDHSDPSNASLQGQVTVR